MRKNKSWDLFLCITMSFHFNFFCETNDRLKQQDNTTNNSFAIN